MSKAQLVITAAAPAHTVAQLQARPDQLSTYYNTIRAHRPSPDIHQQAFNPRPKAFPTTDDITRTTGAATTAPRSSC